MSVIGEYLQTLTPFQEERVLTGTLRAGNYGPWFVGGADIPRCLVGLACSNEKGLNLSQLPFTPKGQGRRVEFQFDALCKRFGVAKAGWVIRQRILRNMTRRTLVVFAYET